MEVGTVLSVVQTVLSVLQTEDLKKALSKFHYKTELGALQKTVEVIRDVLHEAEAKEVPSTDDQNFIQQLKDIAFEVDDLLDEVLTLAEQKKLIKSDGNITQKLTSFLFGSTNPVKMSNRIKEIKNKLDGIAYNAQFRLKINAQPIQERIDRESSSDVKEAEIIGREQDLEKIVGRLLVSSDDQNSNSNVTVLSIVGMGGLGKTALAQLVYNDPRVREAFPQEQRMWTCVSDQDQKVLVVKDILVQILDGNQHGLTLQQMQEPLRAKLKGKKFLLVLDDLWTEDAYQWKRLAKIFKEGERGSYVLVTTRSQKTASVIGGQKHELRGLSKENSWSLFESQAFESQQSTPDEELVKIGKEIVEGCGGVPLAINVAGSLLLGQDKSKWEAVKEIGLSNTEEGERNIMRILKLSYYQLESPLRSCFSYCALFPKDSRMAKDKLIRLWMAQGYISTEKIGEDYFLILLKRCFFQDIKKNKDGDEIESCKIHDLMHDIAKKVLGKEIYASNTLNGKVDKDVRHLSILNWSQFEKCFSLGSTHIRSLLPIELRPPEGHCELSMEALVKSFKRLRVLDLSEKNIKCLPDSIGELLHLRYLDLSGNGMEVLPNSITKLCNLQTLILYCCGLKELPKDLGRLVKLRIIDIYSCRQRYMPRGMGKLTSLHTVKGRYTVGEESWRKWLDGLEELKSLINLKGKLEIEITWPNQDVMNATQEDRLLEGSYLSTLEHLDDLELSFYEEKQSGEEQSHEEDKGIRMRVMEALQPHSNLKGLTLFLYKGTEIPGWITPHLVKLELSLCEKLKYLPWLGNLCHLKYLRLFNLPELEYIRIEDGGRELASTSSAQKLSFYPSLQHLELLELPKWKGWRRGVELELITHLGLPQLKKLVICECKEFTCSILCPVLETLKLEDDNEGMQIEWTNTNNDEKSSEEPAINVPNLRELTVPKGAWLDSMPVESFQSLQKLRIRQDHEMVELPNNLQYLSALQTLAIEHCKNLTEMPNWMPKLTSLKQVHIFSDSESLEERCQKEPPGEYWPLIQHIPDFHIYIRPCS